MNPVPDIVRDVAPGHSRRPRRRRGGAETRAGVMAILSLMDAAIRIARIDNSARVPVQPFSNGFSTRSPSPIRIPCCMSCDQSRLEPLSAAAATIIES